MSKHFDENIFAVCAQRERELEEWRQNWESRLARLELLLPFDIVEAKFGTDTKLPDHEVEEESKADKRRLADQIFRQCTVLRNSLEVIGVAALEQLGNDTDAQSPKLRGDVCDGVIVRVITQQFASLVLSLGKLQGIE